MHPKGPIIVAIALQLLGIILTVIGLRLLTELVQPNLFGRISLLMLIALLLGNAIGQPLLQLFLRHGPDDQTAPHPRDMLQAFAIILLIVFAVGTPLMGFFSPDLLIPGLLVGLVAILEFMVKTHLAALNRDQRHIAFAGYTCATSTLTTFIPIASMWLYRSDVTVYLAGIVIGHGCNLALLRACDRRHPPAPPIRPQPANRNGLLLMAIGMLPCPILAWVMTSSERYAIASFSSLEEVGIYTIAYGLATRPILVGINNIILPVVRPRFYALYRNHPIQATHYLRRAMMATIILMGSGVAALYWLRNGIISMVAANTYVAAANLLAPIGIGYVIWSLFLLTELHIFARFPNPTKPLMTTYLIGALASTGAIIVGASTGGATGVAWAISIAFFPALFTGFHWRRSRIQEGDAD